MNPIKKTIYVLALSLILFLFGKRLISPLFAAFLHELGHICLIKLFGGRVEGVKFDLHGVRIDAAIFELSRFERIAVYAVGIVVNIFTGCIGWLLGFEDFAVCSFALAIINLLPIKTLDGGCILSEIFGKKVFVDILSAVTVFFIWIISTVTLIFTGSVSLWIFSSCLFYSLYLKKA